MKRFMLLLVLTTAMTGCLSPERGGMPVTERISADVGWYCGPGMLGIRAVARFGLGLLGVPVGDLCKLKDAIITAADAEEVVLSP